MNTSTVRALRAQPSSPTIGFIEAVDDDGRIWVNWSGSGQSPSAASFTADWSHNDAIRLTGAKVLLAFNGNDLNSPIIVGLLQERLRRTQVKERVLRLEAGEELVLRCGDSSIALLADGRIVIRGADIVSRASRANKIRGAAVAIN